MDRFGKHCRLESVTKEMLGFLQLMGCLSESTIPLEVELKAGNGNECQRLSEEAAAKVQADSGGSPHSGGTDREEGRLDGERLPRELQWASLFS